MMDSEGNDGRPIQRDEGNAMEVIAEAFRRYTLEEMALAFNGGKDCCVVLHLLYQYDRDALSRMIVVHFMDQNEFPGTKKTWGSVLVPSLTLNVCRDHAVCRGSPGEVSVDSCR
jgi:3'-phosphoadenosine 5'-phosphosulfate sulfotransferase (PAPS reductase)/FAD synthetase